MADEKLRVDFTKSHLSITSRPARNMYTDLMVVPEASFEIDTTQLSTIEINAITRAYNKGALRIVINRLKPSANISSE